MERSPVNSAAPANPSPVPPRPRTAPESSATSTFQETGTSPPRVPELPSHQRGPQVVTLVPASERPEAGVRNGTPLQQQSSPAVQERMTTYPMPMDPTLPPRPSPPRRATRPPSVGNTGYSSEKLVDLETLSGVDVPELSRDQTHRTDHPMTAPPQARLVDNGPIPTRRQRNMSYGAGSVVGRGEFRQSNADWVMSHDGKPRRKTVNERLQPTLDTAIAKRDYHASKAKITGWSLNTAIGLQVLFGSITTGLSAIGTTGKSTAVQTTIFGALSTMLASYLAKARGSNEPELSLLRVRDLEQFIREIRSFQMDHGHIDTDQWDREIGHFRQELESILDGERRPAAPTA